MKHKSGYAKLKQRMYLQMLAMIFCSIGVVALLRFLTRGRLAAGIIHSMIFFTDWSWDYAYEYYQITIRSHMDYIYIFFVLFFLLVMLYFFITWFTRYFDEIIRGVDQLAAEQGEPIVLRRELGFMEDELNEIKDSLAEKTRLAKEAEQRKNDMVVYLAHDIKTPLTSVLGYLEFLNEDREITAAQREDYLRIALEKGYRLEELVNEFFDVTQFGFQQVPLERESLDLSLLLRQLAEDFYPQLTAKGQRIEIRGDAPVFYQGDSDKLGRIFANIFKNAVAYAEENSLISAEVKKGDAAIIVTIANRGKTIAPKDLAAVFDKFYRADTARSSSTGGAGLGLAIAKVLAEAHGGTLTAASEKGITTFTLTLPTD